MGCLNSNLVIPEVEPGRATRTLKCLSLVKPLSLFSFLCLLTPAHPLGLGSNVPSSKLPNSQGQVIPISHRWQKSRLFVTKIMVEMPEKVRDVYVLIKCEKSLKGVDWNPYIFYSWCLMSVGVVDVNTAEGCLSHTFTECTSTWLQTWWIKSLAFFIPYINFWPEE